MKKNIEAVVVLSGGQDSALCLALACRKHGADRVAAITFNYGQRHAVETKFARALARRFKVAVHKVVKLDFYRHLTTNALFDAAAPIAQRRGAGCPTTVVEGRNSFFLTAAGVWAKALADRLGIFDLVAHGTVTCYRGIPGAGCGTCPACKLRAAGLKRYLAERGRARPGGAAR